MQTGANRKTTKTHLMMTVLKCDIIIKKLEQTCEECVDFQICKAVEVVDKPVNQEAEVAVPTVSKESGQILRFGHELSS